MPSIDLASGIYSRNEGIIPETILINMYAEPDESTKQVARIQRPGLEAIAYLPGVINGLFQQDGILNSAIMVVSGNRLYTLDTSNGNFVEKAVLNESGITQFAATKTSKDLLGLVTTSGFYIWDGSVLVPITIPNGSKVVDVESINGYFVIATETGRFYWLKPGETSIDPLDYATAESNPDRLIAIKRRGDELRLYGSSSIEAWYPTGNLDATFARAQGRNFDRGVMSRDTIADFDNTLIWVGNDGIVYLESNVPERISDHGIEEKIRNRESNLSAFTYSLGGHLMYVLRIPGQGTFCFDASTRRWCQYQSENVGYWQPNVSIQVGDQIVLGSSDNGQVWFLNRQLNTDQIINNGAVINIPIVRKVTGNLILGNSKPVTLGNLSVITGSSTPSEIMLRWRDSGGNWTDYKTLPIDQYQGTASIYRCGSARQPIRTFEIQVTSDANVVIWDLSFADAHNR